MILTPCAINFQSEVNFDIDMGNKRVVVQRRRHPVVWHFSVDPVAQGRVETAWNTRSTGSGFCDEPRIPMKRMAIISLPLKRPLARTNLAPMRVAGFGHRLPPHTGDDLNALDLDAPPIDRLCPLPETTLHQGPFSLLPQVHHL